MIQDVNASNLFFSDKPENSVSKRNAGDSKTSGYENVAKETNAKVAKNSKSPNSQTQDAPAKMKVDKPKLGNKDAFFPERPMPYHPASVEEGKEVQTRMQQIQVRPQGELRSIEELEESLSPEQVQALKDLIEKNQQTGDDLKMDDIAGIMSQSFQAAQVSYPVKQIASESIDETTKKTLMQQGLWDIQGQYQAQPAPAVMKMMEFKEQSMMDQGVVPVPKPMAQFMASMENELGVGSDRLVQAYGDLAPQELVQPPQQTMKKVIENLDLNAADQKRAEQLYTRMLDQMQKLDQAGEVEPLIPVKVAPQMAALAPLVQQNEVVRQSQRDAVVSNSNPQAQVQPQQQNPEMWNQSVQQKPAMESDLSQSSFKNEQGFLGQSQKEASTQVHSERKSEIQNKVDLQPTHTLGHASLGQMESPKSFESMMIMGGTAADGVMGGQKSEAKQEAIQSIINNAQALSQKGGGEMKLTLRPDHLGEIQLKVSMNGSNVDVQMIAEKSEAKKLIEQNISELKHGLAQHNLSMEKIDVSIGDRSAQFQNHQGRPDFNQAREYSQQFAQGQGERRQKDSESEPRRVTIEKPQPDRFRSILPQRKGVAGRLNVVA